MTGGERLPEVSVVVASLNAASTLQRCIDSVARQRGVEVELLIVDGGSTDGTLQILESNGPSIAYWESEPDRGVYHAWNKALERATGRWVCFLGADDELAEPGTLKTLIALGERMDVELVCSRVRYRASEKAGSALVGQPWSWSKMTRFMCVAHPGLLHRRSLFDRYGKFSEQYRIAGDYEYLLRLGDGVTSAFLDRVSVNVGGVGLSSDTVATLKEVRLIQSLSPEIGRLRAGVNYWRSRAERILWTILDIVPIRRNALTRLVGHVFGMLRHDFQQPEDNLVAQVKGDAKNI
ncbi:MAG TPA: glycosyltransferase family 2 protein [Actinomycetota bacterium]|nr:glycosyltransferase family 2 protein [Actinomycetota bacterium]